MKLREVVEISESLKKLKSINQKIEILSEFFKKLKGEEGGITVSLLTGENPYGSSGVGWRTLKDLFHISYGNESIELLELKRTLKDLSKIKGKESKKRRMALIYRIFKKLNYLERKFFVSFLLGEVRQGAGKGIIKKAIAKTFEINEEEIDDLILKRGNFIHVVENIFKKGKAFIKDKIFEITQPFSPMLADIIYSVDELPDENFAVEYKIDGMRIQVHRKERDVKIFSRNLRDVTQNLFEIAENLKEIKGDFVLDGEALLFDEKGKPLPFQDMMSIISRKKRERIKNLHAFFFDILYKDGEALFGKSNKERWEVLKNTVPKKFLIKRIETEDKERIKRFFEESISKGHEGVMIKKLDSPYFIGSRKKYWLKLKSFYTLDLVILEAEWGHGRRKGWLSNFLLGCLDRDKEKFLPLGKTFKGLTDEEFKEITKLLLSKKIMDKEWGIVVNPEVVVEINFSEIEKSPFYEGGFALRFARIKRIRHDKNPYEIATIEEVERIFEEVRKKKGKWKA